MYTLSYRTFSTTLLRVDEHVSARKSLNIKHHTLITLINIRYTLKYYFHSFFYRQTTTFALFSLYVHEQTQNNGATI